jgi:hypothetical protein
MDRMGRKLAGIERRLVAEDPVLAEAFALWDARCTAASEPAVEREEPLWITIVAGLVMGMSALGAATIVPGWFHGSESW